MSETRWTLAWNERPVEEARNLNPAFCAELIARTVAEYHKARMAPLSMATAFLVLPLTLHKPARTALPGKANTTFATWIASNNPLLAELPGRVSRLRPISREALLFSIRYRMNTLNNGGLVPGSKPIKPSSRPATSTDDVNEARAVAALLGRWFGAQASESAILKGFGVAP
ncbi:three component ABC system middle component [Cereibacter sphaeroides]|uniref:three component ABC system middle component n=1 Tax=Cereibacter sphaeroides TaxID=1063 RepID=UPI003990407E